MDAMLGYLKQNKSMPHVVLIDDISRLARGIDAHWKLRESISKAGGLLESPSVQFGDDSDSQLIENMLASTSQHFRQKNREQTISRMMQRMKNGYYVAAIPPAGFKYIKGVGKELVRDEPVASIVQEALEGFASGRFGSQGEVRQFLQDQPEYPRNKKGIVTHQKAHNLLRCHTYAGMLDGTGWGLGIIKGNHPPIIPYEMFLKNQDLLTGKRRVANRMNIGQDFILRGAVACGDCGLALTACWSKSSTGKQYPYYLCHKKGCDSYRKSIPRDKLEGEFAELLKSLKPTRKLFDVASMMFKDLWEHQARSNKERRQRLNLDVAKVDKEMTKLVDKLIDSNSTILSQKIEERLKTLEQNKLAIVQKQENLGQPKHGFNEMFERALTFLANPHKI